MLLLPHTTDTADAAAANVPSTTGLTPADFDHFVSKYYERLLAVSNRMLRSPDDAADALQEALLSAWVARRRFRGRSTVYTWLYRIVSNVCLMKLRNRSAKKRQSGERPVEVDSTAGRTADDAQQVVNSVELAEQRQTLHESLNQLPNHYRQILWLRDIEQLSTGDTAELLSVTPGMVKTRLCRAREALRGLLRGISV